MNMKLHSLLFAVLFFTIPLLVKAQENAAHTLNEILLEGIRNDFARPTVHARNLFHSSVAMYDAWAAYDTEAKPYLLGNTINGFTCDFDGVPIPADINAAREEAMSFAVYRLLRRRFQSSPGRNTIYSLLDQYMVDHGYDTSFIGQDPSTGNPASLGNYIGACLINLGNLDNSNEIGGYDNTYYTPYNDPLIMAFPGNPDIKDPNRWQPLTLNVFIDQSGNVIPFNTPEFLSPEWGKVTPFSLTPEQLTVYKKQEGSYYVYNDPGAPPYLDTTAITPMSEEYKWGFSLVSVWSSHLDPTDGVEIDISPAAIGNNQNYPTDIPGLRNFYNREMGGDPSSGHNMNPVTGQPYAPNIVKRGDYARVLAEFWADGPDSETPPGHWFTLLNFVSEHPDFVKQFNGQDEVLDDLEWFVKAYFTLGGAMHDSAVCTWGIKGHYDYVRPVSAIRAMAEYGQSTDPNLPNYHVAGFELEPGFIEMVGPNDPLVGANQEHLNKIKLYAWRGPDFINNPQNSTAGVGWILAENWWPFQRPTFVSPNFAGYLSGHSTFSRAAAEVLTNLTGDAFFPGGMGTFDVEQNEFLVFEDGPSESLTLQWATYADASDQTSLSRIWGGIHPPADDIPGRLIGMDIGDKVFDLARSYFYSDADNDGFYSYEDCDDTQASVFPNAPEVCDNIDNDCNGNIDENLPTFTYYLDNDGDGFGDAALSVAECNTTPNAGYVTNADDCNDASMQINPSSIEICDNIDNDCNGFVDDGLTIFTYYMDADGDGFGDAGNSIDTCALQAPMGFVIDLSDCNDNDATINPNNSEICDDIDNDCNGAIDDGLPLFVYYADADNDGFGDTNQAISICQQTAPVTYVSTAGDCDDSNPNINPNTNEICDNIDNDCNGAIDDGIPYFTFYNDLDNDGFGDLNDSISVCQNTPPASYVANSEDCNDQDERIFPGSKETPDNGIDEDCTGTDLFETIKIFPNPSEGQITIHYPLSGTIEAVLVSMDGRILETQNIDFVANRSFLDMSHLPAGVYILRLLVDGQEDYFSTKVVKM